MSARGIRRIFKVCASLLAIAGVASQVSPCPAGVTSRMVSTAADALELIDALSCSGAGQFVVDWTGEVLLSRTISVSNGSILTVTGSAGAAVIHGGETVRLFEVIGGSKLELNSVSLIGGSAEDGGAVQILGELSQLAASNCSFTGNNATNDGGAIFSDDGGTVTIDGDSFFANNTAQETGGAICAYNGAVVAIQGKTSFAENVARARSGGAIAAKNNTMITLEGETAFAGNVVNLSGGAIVFSANSTVSVKGETTFAANKAGDTERDAGGAIFSLDGTLIIEGKAYFLGNTAGTGGAITAAYSNTSIIAEDLVFADNRASDLGGALRVVGGTVAIEGGLFSANTADGGGAIRTSFGGIVRITGDTTFIANDGGDFGGAVSAFNGTVVIQGNTTFANNAADICGGAIGVTESTVEIQGNTTFANNTATYCGGAIGATDCTVEIQGNTTFANNTANFFGGAISSASCEMFSIDGETTFSHNAALDTTASVGGALETRETDTVITGKTAFFENTAILGGAIFAWEAANVTFEDETIFAANFANSSGGAIGGSNCTIIIQAGTSNSETKAPVIEGSTSFLKNAARAAGGAIRLEKSNVIINGETTFAENAVTVGNDTSYDFSGNPYLSEQIIGVGGAIYVSDGSNVTINGETAFTENSVAIGGGGAVGATDAFFTINGSTAFANNSASSFGAAVYSWGGTFNIAGETTFFGNVGDLSISVSSGGAITSRASLVAIEGNTTFESNSAASAGAVDIWDEGFVAFKGVTAFFRNAAGFWSGGGAIGLGSGGVAIEGHTSFVENTGGGRSGGAIDAVGPGNVTMEGHTTFVNNIATVGFGGAMSLSNINLSLSGIVEWTGNMAGFSGGAVFLEDVEFNMDGVDSSFSNNSAGEDGGAIAASAGSLTIRSPVPFLNNTAQGNGGAIYLFSSKLITEQGAVFTGNRAINGAGGGVYSFASVISIKGSVFAANDAIWGGGMALFFSGSVWDKESPIDSGPANTTSCVFEGNTAIDGGGIYSTAGYDIIKDSWFGRNIAGGAGGAFFHSGLVVEMDRASFFENRAAGAGLAIQSLGVVENMINTTFESNTYFCPSGQFGYDIGASEDEVAGSCRFDVVCSTCAASCEEIPETVTVINNDSVPVCEAAMTGVVDSQGPGTTLRTLDLDQGYYRTSVASHEILECYQEEACNGGVEFSRYCASGYKGPYCAVCEEGFASGHQYSCSSCVGDNKRTAIGVSIALFLVGLAFVALATAELVRVVDEGHKDTSSSWERRVASCRTRIASAVPLTPIKTVVVAWQIITQFSSVVHVVYPGIYERFLSALDAVNFNLGFLLSISCLVDTNFYGRLFFATIGPVVVLGALAVTYRVSCSRNRNSFAGMEAAKHKHLSVALFLLFVVYSSVSFTIFQTFACETLDNGVEYLRADYSLSCSTRAHTAMKVYAGLMIIVYPVGIPSVFAWWLFSNRHGLLKIGDDGDLAETDMTRHHLLPMRSLWGPYKPHRYYYEVVECARRIVLTGLAVFILPGSAAQVALEVVFAAISIGIFEMLAPFGDPLDAWLYRSGSWVIFFSMYLALLLKVDASDEDSHSQEVFARLLIVAHLSMVFMIFAQAVLSVKRSVVEMRDEPVANKSFRSSSLHVSDVEGVSPVERAVEPQSSTEESKTA